MAEKKPMPVCVNCGQPAQWLEKGEGFVPDYLCDPCAQRVYQGRMDMLVTVAAD